MMWSGYVDSNIQTAYIEFDATADKACRRESFFSDWIENFIGFDCRFSESKKVLLSARRSLPQEQKFVGGSRRRFY